MLKTKKVAFLASLLCLGIIYSSFRDLNEIAYKPSPLAKLMVQMHLDMKNYRQLVIENKSIPDLNKKWQKMKTATPTDAGVKGEKYDAFAADFLRNYNDMLQSKQTDRKLAFNTLVSNCISCHESFCPGPINMIKKLHIN